MTLRNGKFYDSDGNVVPLEHGNKEQFKLFEKFEALKDGIIVIEKYTCLCGSVTPFPYSQLDEEGSYDVDRKCPGCGIKYRFYLHDDEVPCVKMLKRK